MYVSDAMEPLPEQGAAPRLRLAVFDLDGTLKARASPWRLLHEALGLGEMASRYGQQFLAGTFDYHEWARLDAALWKGINLDWVEELFRRSPYRPGAHQLLRFLRDASVPSVIISTGLDAQARHVAADLGIWRTITNELLVVEGRLTGEVRVVVTESNKGAIMDGLCAELAVRGSECLAVGDGLADIALFARAGLSVAVCPTDEQVRSAADVVLDDGDLAAMIPLISQHFIGMHTAKTPA